MKALVLSGGGARGSYECGALKHLLGERQEKYDIITGTSVGALNGAFVAMFSHGQEQMAARELENLWLAIDTSKVWKKWYWGMFGILPVVLPRWLGGKLSAYSTAPLQAMVERHLNATLIAGSGKKLRIGAVDLDSSRRSVWTEEHVQQIKKAVLASSSFPLFFEPIEIDGHLYTDAGVREICPISDAIDAGADEIHLITTGPEDVTSPLDRKSGLSLGIRVLDVMGSEIEHWDVKAVELYNALYESRHPLATGKYHINMKVLRPKHKILDNSLDFSPELVRKNIELGLADARAFDWDSPAWAAPDGIV